jgi:hypothetical protein
VFRGVGEVAANTPDLYTTVDGINVYSSMAGVTNLVDTDLTNWTNTLGTVSTEDKGNGITEISVSNPGATSTLDYDFLLASNDRTSCAEIKLISGGANPSTDYLSFVETNALKGTAFLLEDLTTEWQRICPKVTSAEATNRLRFRFNSDVTVVLQVRNVRAVDLSAPGAAPPDGSAAGYTYGTDLLSASPTWPSVGTIVQAVMPYGYSGADNPISETARFFESGNNSAANNTDATQITGSGFTPTASTGGSVTENVINVHSMDWDEIKYGGRWSTNSRVTLIDSEIPSGTITLGNDPTGIRPLHGIGTFFLFPRP